MEEYYHYCSTRIAVILCQKDLWSGLLMPGPQNLRSLMIVLVSKFGPSTTNPI